MPIIRDPVHNQRQGKYGLVWIEPDSEYKDGRLAVYDKERDVYLRFLPAGHTISGTEIEPADFTWCGIDIKWELKGLQKGHSTGLVSELLEKHLREDHPGLLANAPLVQPVIRNGRNSIYPLEE